MVENKRSIWENQSEIDNWVLHKNLFAGARDGIMNFIHLETFPFLKNLKSGNKILDLGSGANNEEYLFRCPKGVGIICLDSSFGMLSRSPTELPVQADARILPVKSDSIDLCTSFFLIRYLTEEEWTLLLGEIRRVLKPDGQFIIIDLVENDYPNQLSICDANLLAQRANQVGLTDLQVRNETHKCTVRGNLGGYSYEQVMVAELGVLTGRKGV